ncbi:MAG: SDR family oxidoreductase [Paludisphaera borealis]|uniref:SDR family NAD(P)-dependent oxidoreductase n=1 Tax=Paludisphaera borealis TaxID=1387353 RepID=UPI00284FB0C2|nr:SDR family oxidoreductase [Paludisphaera borealis]MDR3622021.1 SDR family oxidoreductase [Paludisphaera borealis]
MIIKDKTAVITGAGSGIGQAVAIELAERGVGGLGLIDSSDSVINVARAINDRLGRPIAEAVIGDVTDPAFRTHAFDLITDKFSVPSICVPAAGISRDQLAVKVDKQTGKSIVYPIEKFREIAEVNLIAPTYWALETISRIAEDRHRRGLTSWNPDEGIQGTIIFLGSVSSHGNTGQVAYSGAKAGLEGVAATLAKEAIHYGVRCAVIHPGYTDTPMVRALGDEYIKKNILPYTQLRRLIAPEEIADAIYFLICNSAVSGQLWADAGWHPTA